MPSGEERDARWRTERLLAERPVENQTARREAVKVRRLDDQVAVAPELWPHVVGGDEQNVGLSGAEANHGRHDDAGKERTESEDGYSHGEGTGLAVDGQFIVKVPIRG
jgi:hypothetical protein